LHGWLANRGQLDHVFELAEVPYGHWLVPSTEAHTEASKKRKMDAAGKTPVKHTKASGKKKVEALKIVVSRIKTGSK
jgi:hypothetical protein